MRRPTTRSSLLRSLLPSLSRSALLAGALVLTACGDQAGSAETGQDPGTTAAESADSADPTGTDPTGGDPTSDDSTSADPTVDPGTSSGPDPDTGATDTTGPEPTLEEQLEGRWLSEACEPMPQADGSVLYFLRDFTLGVDSWSILGTIYGDEACSFALLTLEIGGDYEVVGPAAIDGAYEANFDRSSIALTPHVADFVGWFDAEGCGSEPWAIGVGQDVTEAGCAFIPSAAVCPVEHDLVALDGVDRLFFGQRPIEGDMCSPRSRPTALGEYAVVRQDG